MRPRAFGLHLVFLAASVAAQPLLQAAQFDVATFGASSDGTSDATPALQAAIDAAIRSGEGAIVHFPAGHYRLQANAKTPRTHLELRGAHGLKLVGEAGTYLDSADPTCAFFRIEDSSDIAVSSFQLDRHPFVFTQGWVRGISLGDRTADLVVDDGYDELDSPYIRPLDFLMIFTDPASGTWDHDAPWPPRVVKRERMGPGRWRVTLDRAPQQSYNGKPFVLWANHYGGSAFTMDRARNVAVEDVAYYGGGADGGFFVSHCEGRISFHRFSVAPPRGSGRRFSASGGAMVFNNRIQLVVDDCDFAATDDDGINMGGNSSHIFAQKSPRVLRIEGGRGDYRPGDRVALWDWSTKQERARAAVVRTVREGRGLIVTFDRDLAVARTGLGPWEEFETKHVDTKTPAGREAMHAARRANESDGIDRVIDLDDVGSEIVRNSRFQSYRARNLLIKANDALIENNLFHDTAMAAILVGPEFYWDEGPTISHLIIRHNRFVNISGSSIFIGAHHSELSRDNRNITIEDNVFLDFGHFAFGASGRPGSPIYVRNAEGVSIQDNRIESPDPRCPEAPRILVEASDQVRQNGNQIVLSRSESTR